MGLALESADRQPQLPAQLIKIMAAAVLELHALEEIPDTLVGVQLRRVGGQALQVQPLRRTCSQEVLDRLTAMNRRTIPDDEQLAPHLPQELAEEGHDRRTSERRLLDMDQEPPIRSDGTDGREMVMSERGAQHRRLPAWGVCPGDEGQQIEARLVYEEDGALLGSGFA